MFNIKEKKTTTHHLRLLESHLDDPFSLKSQRNQLLQVSHQPYQDLKVGSYVRLAYIQCRLNLFVIRAKRTNRKPPALVEIRLKVDISLDVTYTG